MIPFEESNLEAFTLFARIEVTIREFLAKGLHAKYGQNWRKMLPGSLLSKVRISERDEFSRAQFGFVRLGPLYYLSFGELCELAGQRDGLEILRGIGGKSLVNQLGNLLPPRNALAHCRPITPSGLAAVKAVYAQIEAGIGPKLVAELTSHPDVGVPPEHAARTLKTFLLTARDSVTALEPAIPLDDELSTIKNQYWWGNNVLAGFDCDMVEAALSFIDAYNQVPRGVGAAGERSALAKRLNASKTLSQAADELSGVVE